MVKLKNQEERERKRFYSRISMMQLRHGVVEVGDHSCSSEDGGHGWGEKRREKIRDASKSERNRHALGERTNLLLHSRH